MLCSRVLNAHDSLNFLFCLHVYKTFTFTTISMFQCFCYEMGGTGWVIFHSSTLTMRPSCNVLDWWAKLPTFEPRRGHEMIHYLSDGHQLWMFGCWLDRGFLNLLSLVTQILPKMLMTLVVSNTLSLNKKKTFPKVQILSKALVSLVMTLSLYSRNISMYF